MAMSDGRAWLARRLADLSADIDRYQRTASELDLPAVRLRCEAAGHLITDGRRVLEEEIEGGETDG